MTMKQFRDTKYEVSECGIIVNSTTGRVLKPHFNKSGYVQVNLGSKLKVYIHRVVAECYLTGFDLSLDINHIDGNKENNHYTNLECISHSENMKHARLNGLIKSIQGSKNHVSKLVEDDVINIRRLFKEGKSYNELSKLYNMSYSGIYSIIKNKIWKHI